MSPIATALFSFLGAMIVASGMSAHLEHFHSGSAIVHYFRPPNVVLDLRLSSGGTNRILLSYKEVGQQRRGDIWNAKVVAEEQGHFVIFTDRFSSNSNIQGECGASDGEQYLHVVSLASPMREMLSLNIDSCYQELKPIDGYPKYDPLTHVLLVKIEHEDTKKVSLRRYHLNSDGAVQTID